MLKPAARVSASSEDDGPVSYSLMSQLYRATTDEIPALVDDLPIGARAQLAVFCYSRAHLRAAGRVIAARCDDTALLRAAGPGIGKSLIEAKRADALDRFGVSGESHSRPKVTLATAADMRRRAPEECAVDESAYADEEHCVDQ